MSDTYIDDCRICGEHTDTIERECLNCNSAKLWLEDQSWMGKKENPNMINKDAVISLLNQYANT